MAAKAKKIVSSISIIKEESPSAPFQITMKGPWSARELEALQGLMKKALVQHMVQRRKELEAKEK